MQQLAQAQRAMHARLQGRIDTLEHDLVALLKVGLLARSVHMLFSLTGMLSHSLSLYLSTFVPKKMLPRNSPPPFPSTSHPTSSKHAGARQRID